MKEKPYIYALRLGLLDTYCVLRPRSEHAFYSHKSYTGIYSIEGKQFVAQFDS